MTALTRSSPARIVATGRRHRASRRQTLGVVAVIVFLLAAAGCSSGNSKSAKTAGNGSDTSASAPTGTGTVNGAAPGALGGATGTSGARTGGGAIGGGGASGGDVTGTSSGSRTSRGGTGGGATGGGGTGTTGNTTTATAKTATTPPPKPRFAGGFISPAADISNFDCTSSPTVTITVDWSFVNADNVIVNGQALPPVNKGFKLTVSCIMGGSLPMSVEGPGGTITGTLGIRGQNSPGITAGFSF